MINKIQVHSAVTVFEGQESAIIIGPKLKETELAQYACEFKGGQIPVPETYFRKAFDEMKELCLQTLREKGLVK